MPRTGNGTRNATRMALGRVRRDANTRFSGSTFPQRARATVKRICLDDGASVPSRAVFSVVGARQLDPQPGRGTWLTRQATVHPAERPTSDERAEKIREQRAHRDPRREALGKLRSDRRALTRAERQILAKRRMIAEGRLFDQWMFSLIYAEMERLYSDDLESYVAALRVLDLRDQASREWETRLLNEITDGNLAVDRGRADVEARQAEYIACGWLSDPARAQRAIQLVTDQLPLWDTSVTRTPLWDSPTKKATVAPRKARTATLERPDITTGNKFLDHALNTD